MKHTHTYLGFKTVLVIGLVGLSGNAFSDGYRNPPPTAEGIGKSGVNSVWVDDASAISYNPANLAFQTNQSFVLSTTFARLENTYSPVAGVSFNSDAVWTLLPNIYYANPVGDSGITWGFGITTPHGQGVAWDESDFGVIAALTGTATPYEATMALVDIGPSVAVKITDSLAVGVGLDIYVSQLNLKALIPTGGPIVDSEGVGYGAALGGNLALTWLPIEGHRAVLTYKSQFSIDYKGDFEITGVSPTGDFGVKIEFPNIVGFGYGIQLTDAIQIEALLEWVEWSINDKQTLSAGVLGDLPIDNSWNDTINFGIGGSWQASESITLRAGYQFLETPIPDETITPLLTDADRHAISFGVGYALGAHAVDLAYTFSIYEDRDNTSSGTYDIDSDLVGLTYSLSF